MALDVESLYQNLTGGCWACDGLIRFADFGLDLADQAYGQLATNLGSVVGLGMAVWLLSIAARTILPFGPADRASWNLAARRLFQFALVLAFLQASQPFWDLLFMPLIATGVGLAMQLSSLTGGQGCAAVAPAAGLAGAKAAVASMSCPLSAVQDVFSKGIVTGLAISLGGGWRRWFDLLTVAGLFGELVQFLSGLALAAVFAFGFLTYPLLLIDVLGRAVIVAAMAPLALAASLFGPGRRLTHKALWNLAHSALALVFVSAAAGLAATGMNAVYNEVGGADWPSLIAQLESGQAELSPVDRSYWSLMVAGVIAIFTLRQSSRMAAQFTEALANDFSGILAATASLADVPVHMTAAMLRVAGVAAGPLLRRTGERQAAERTVRPRPLTARVSGREQARRPPLSS